jgi:hypothetical protein
VATLQHDNGYAAYAAVGEVGLMAIDFSKAIPGPLLPKEKELPGFYPGDYIDVAVVGVPKPAPTLMSISVSPPTLTREVGNRQQYKAMGTYSDGTEIDLTPVVTWVSSNPAVATIDATGLATAVSGGQTNITASKDGVISNTAVLTIKVLSSILITPDIATRPVNEPIQYTAIGTYSDGTTADITNQATWISGNSAVATIGITGVAVGHSQGQTNITASKDGVISNTAVLTIKELSSISITPVNETRLVNEPIQYTAIGTYSDGTTADITHQSTWISGNSAVATIGITGVAVGHSQGQTNITASKDGVISNTAALTVTSPPLGPMVLINEVVVEPMLDWSDSLGGDGIPFNSAPGTGVPNTADQWVEITNIGGLVDLSGWTLGFTDPMGASVTVTLGATLLGPGQYLVLGAPGAPVGMFVSTSVTLRDASGLVVDTVDLLAVHALVGLATGVSDEAVVRLFNSSDTGQPTDFKRRAATIGAQNPSQ